MTNEVKWGVDRCIVRRKLYRDEASEEGGGVGSGGVFVSTFQSKQTFILS